MTKYKHPHASFAWLREVVLHVGVTVLAIAIAFSLPTVAQFILFKWWPRVMADSNLLLITEISLAALLVLFFNAAKNSVAHRASVGCAHMASLVHARIRGNWLSRWRERLLFNQMPAARDAYVLTVTGKDTFAGEDSRFRAALQSAYEIRVLLVNPASLGAQLRVDSLPDEQGTPAQMFEEIGHSIDYLKSLRQLGKKVTLKFYDHQPFWKLVILGEHVWVQYCHGGDSIDSLPEYVFALNHKDPRRGLFIPFYMHFLELWGQQRNPELDFDSGELVYRDETGNELRRLPLQQGPQACVAGGPCAVLQAQPS